MTPFPAPLLAAGVVTAAVGRRSPRLALLAGLLPWLAYPRWMIDLATARNLEPLAYPYLQLAQELATVVGEIEGRRAGYRPVPSAQLTDTATDIPTEAAQCSRVSP